MLQKYNRNYIAFSVKRDLLNQTQALAELQKPEAAVSSTDPALSTASSQLGLEDSYKKRLVKQDTKRRDLLIKICECEDTEQKGIPLGRMQEPGRRKRELLRNQRITQNNMLFAITGRLQFLRAREEIKTKHIYTISRRKKTPKTRGQWVRYVTQTMTMHSSGWPITDT